MELKRHQQLLAPGEKMTGDYEVTKGLIALTKATPGFQLSIVALFFPGDAVVADTGCDVVALENSELFRIDEHVDFVDRPRALRIAYAWLARNNSVGADSRVAHLLCEIMVRSDFDGDVLTIPTQEEIGQMTGQTSVNVCRVIADLRSRGVIAPVDRRRIKVKDADELRRIGRFDGSYLD